MSDVSKAPCRSCTAWADVHETSDERIVYCQACGHESREAVKRPPPAPVARLPLKRQGGGGRR